MARAVAIAAITVVIALAATTAVARAHLVAHHGAHASLKQIEASQIRNLAHAKYVCKRGGGANKRWSCAAVKWLGRELSETERALHPVAVAVPVATAISSGYASLCGSSCVSCESGHDPNAWSPDHRYWGWYQFDYGTWKAHGGVPSHWGSASTSAGEQTAVASRVRYDAWPNC